MSTWCPLSAAALALAFPAPSMSQGVSPDPTGPAPDGAEIVMGQTPLLMEGPLRASLPGAGLGSGLGPAVDARVSGRRSIPMDDVHGTLTFAESADGIWARGRTYKARASKSGFTYVPFFGAGATKVYPIEMALASVTHGERDIPVEGAAEASRVRSDLMLMRGELEARYSLGLDSVEQSFTIPGPFSAAPLEVEISVKTDLDVRYEGDGLRFHGPEGDVGYSAAIAFDARGLRTPVLTELRGRSIVLTVPEEFVASAVGPIVVDPTFETFAVNGTSRDQRDVDVTYDLSSDSLIYVHEDTFASQETDIHYRRLDMYGNLVASGWIELGLQTWRDPRVANLNHANTCLCVARRPIRGQRDEIVGRTFTVGGASVAMGPELVIGTTTNGGWASWSNFRADVGGNSSSSTDAKFCVVWERRFSDGDTYPRFRTVDANGSMGPVRALENAPNLLCGEVVISDSTGDPAATNLWNVAYRREHRVTGLEELRGAQIAADGGIAQAPQALLTLGASQTIRDIEVSESIPVPDQDPTYLVMYDDVTASEVDVQLLMCRGNQAVATCNLNDREHALLGRIQDAAHVAGTASGFTITYMERDANEWIPYLSVVDVTEPNEFAIAERRVRLGAGWANMDTGVQIASRYSGGLLTSELTGLGFAARSSSTNGWDVFGATHIASGSAAVGYQFCSGVPNMSGERGFLNMRGNRWPGWQKSLDGTGLPTSGVFSVLMCGSDVANIPAADGGLGTLCLGGTMGQYSSMIKLVSLTGDVSFQIDPTELPQGSSSFAATSGLDFYWQLWHRDYVGTTVTSNYTNAVAIRFR